MIVFCFNPCIIYHVKCVIKLLTNILLLSATSQRAVLDPGRWRGRPSEGGWDRAAAVGAGAAQRETGPDVQTGTDQRQALTLKQTAALKVTDVNDVFLFRSERSRSSWRQPGESWPGRKRPTRNYSGTSKRWDRQETDKRPFSRAFFDICTTQIHRDKWDTQYSKYDQFPGPWVAGHLEMYFWGSEDETSSFSGPDTVFSQ